MARYLPHPSDLPSDLQAARRELQDALVAGVERVHRHPSSNPGVYVRGTGALLMDWQLADLSSELKISPSTPSVNRAQFSLLEPSTSGRISFLETDVGTATLIIVEGLRSRSENVPEKAVALREQAAKVLRSALRVAINEEGKEEECEVLYGRAGLLYALLLLHAKLAAVSTDPTKGNVEDDPLVNAVIQLCSERHIDSLVHDIISRGKAGAQRYAHKLSAQERDITPPLMWSWHGKRYLGAAHGVAGILQMLISIPPRLLAPHWEIILEAIEWLIGIQQPSGNWPHKASRIAQGTLSEAEEEIDQLVQWCHGAPGVLILLSALLKRASSPSAKSQNLIIPQQLSEAISVALSRGGHIVYEKGLLRKGIGLCHGVAGSVYALLAVSDILDAGRIVPYAPWFLRAVHLAHLATAYEKLMKGGEMSIPDHPYSLYEGVAGMCCAWGEVIRRFKRGEVTAHLLVGCGTPGYDDLDSFG